MGSGRIRSAKRLKLRDLCQEIEVRAPLATAASFDHVGLMLGDLNQSVERVIVSVDLTEESIRAAISKKAQVVITHHPPIFPANKGLKRLVEGKPEVDLSARLLRAARAGLAVYSCHSNFDVCGMEALESLSRDLGVTPMARLFDSESAELLKLVVFVPVTHVDLVRNAIFRAGAGHIGHYSQCSFGLEGEGTFLGDGATQPFIGKTGVSTRAREMRLETVLPRGLKQGVLRALRQAHPYEEIAYDLYRLEQGAAPGGMVRGLGYGMVADVGVGSDQFLKRVKSAFRVDRVWASKLPKKIKRMGFVAGKGSSFIRSAAEQGCDLFVSGELGFHTVLEAERLGVSVIEVGHRQSERYFLRTIKEWVTRAGVRAFVVETHAQRLE